MDKFDIFFADECHFHQHGSRCKTWIPPENKDPIVKHAPTRKSMALFGAVHEKTGKMITMAASIFNAETFLQFLKQVVRKGRKNRKILFVLDNARYHHAVLLQKWLKENKHRIELLFLPPYSPELNHIERVWKLTRRMCTHNKFFSTLDELVQNVEQQMARWSKSNEPLKKLCCII
jgi:transposase